MFCKIWSSCNNAPRTPNGFGNVAILLVNVHTCQLNAILEDLSGCGIEAELVIVLGFKQVASTHSSLAKCERDSWSFAEGLQA